MKCLFSALALLIAMISQTASATFLIPELEPAQKVFKEKDLCVAGVVDIVRPLAEKGHPEAMIALGDIYNTCVKKEIETVKFKNLFEVYLNAATRDSISPAVTSKKTHARRWAYHRLWSLMYYGNEVEGFKPMDYAREIHILAAAALLHGGQDVCWRASGVWLESRNGCDAIGQLANDYVYPTGDDGWKSPLKNAPLKGAMLQIHRANESNLDKEEVKWAFDFATRALEKNEKLSGKVVCTNKANFSGGIQALRQNLSNSPYYGHCRYQDWSGMGKTLDATSFTDYGLVVGFANGAGWGLVDLERLPRLAFDAAIELGMDIRDIEKMDAFVNALYTKIFENRK
jgi:hypothetical protein